MLSHINEAFAIGQLITQIAISGVIVYAVLQLKKIVLG